MSNQAAAGALAGGLYSPEDVEKARNEVRSRDLREAKFRCLDLACRTHPHDPADDLIIAARKFHAFITA
jgi:hypothetical protein